MQFSETDIRGRLLGARLPAMPQILLKLLEQCQNDNVGIEALGELIAKDPGISSKIFSVANSSAYQRSGNKLGLRESLLAIGTDMLKTLVISESVLQIFNDFSHSDDASLRKFWAHSLSTAVIAREIAIRMAYPNVEEAYLAGLLHDVGRLALLRVAPAEYAASFRAVDDESLCAIELRTLRITHAEAGAWLIEKWKLDSFMADSVLYHHENAVRLTSAHPLIRIVKLAHMMSQNGVDDTALDNVGSLCGLDNDVIAVIGEHAVEQVRQAADHLGINITDFGETQEQPTTSSSPPDPIRQRISGQVSNLLLTSTTGRSLSRRRSREELKQSVLQSLRIVFDFDEAVFLQLDTTGKMMTGFAVGSHGQRLNEFSVPLSGDSLVANSATQKIICYAQTRTRLLSVSDEQLLRFLDTDSFVALPLIADDRCTAVLIGGIASHRLHEIQERDSFLKAFCAQAANALADVAAKQRDSDEQAEAVAQTYRAASRQMAHEVNNPLSIIKNYLSILDRKMQRNEQVVGEISILNEEIDRVGKIIEGLVDLRPHEDTVKNEPADLNLVTEDAVRLLQNTEFVPPSIRVVTRLNGQPGGIRAGADAVKQILLNLLMNAVQAMQGGGEIEIINKGQINRDGHLYIELAICDTGPGITDDMLATLFTPGNSNKVGTYRGQGLSIVRRLVREIDGLIMCRSTSSGTTFEILFPLLEAGKTNSDARPSKRGGVDKLTVAGRVPAVHSPDGS